MIFIALSSSSLSKKKKKKGSAIMSTPSSSVSIVSLLFLLLLFVLMDTVVGDDTAAVVCRVASFGGVPVDCDYYTGGYTNDASIRINENRYCFDPNNSKSSSTLCTSSSGTTQRDDDNDDDNNTDNTNYDSTNKVCGIPVDEIQDCADLRRWTWWIILLLVVGCILLFGVCVALSRKGRSMMLMT